MLSFTGNFEFLAKDSLITDLKQNLLGKVGKKKDGVAKINTGEQPSHWKSSRCTEYPLLYRWMSPGQSGNLLIQADQPPSKNIFIVVRNF